MGAAGVAVRLAGRGVGRRRLARLATAVERCRSVLARDVVVDVGRLGEASGWPVIAACDVVVLVVRPTARSVQGARAAAEILRARLGDLDAVRLLVNGAGPYPPAQVAEQLGVAGVEVIPADPRAAAALVDGSVATVRGLTRSRLSVRPAWWLNGSADRPDRGWWCDERTSRFPGLDGDPRASGQPSWGPGSRPGWWTCGAV